MVLRSFGSIASGEWLLVRSSTSVEGCEEVFCDAGHLLKAGLSGLGVYREPKGARSNGGIHMDIGVYMLHVCKTIFQVSQFVKIELCETPNM